MTVAAPPAGAAGPPSRVLGFWMTVALVMGNMIGSGIFLLPSSLAAYGGLSLVGWIVSMCGALLLATVFARLARLEPAAGGPYAYTRRAFGDLPAFLVAWGYWISMWTGLGALAVALVGYLGHFAPYLSERPMPAALSAIAAVWLLVGVNVAGVRAAGWIQVATTLLKVAPLGLVGVFGLFHLNPAHFTVSQSGTELVSAIPAVSALTLWAFLGLESATVPAASIRDPAFTIPRATLTGTVLTALVYVVSTVGVMGVLGPAQLGASTAPFADAARVLVGDWAAAAAAGGAAVSCFGALNGWTLLAGQLPLAAARDGLFPAVFGRVTPRDTPAAGLIIAGLLTTGLVALNYTRGLVELFTFFILLATLNSLIPYVFASLAVFLLHGDAERPPLSAAGAAAAALAFLYSVWAMSGAGKDVVYWGFLLLICGLPVYVSLVRRRRIPAERHPP